MTVVLFIKLGGLFELAGDCDVFYCVGREREKEKAGRGEKTAGSVSVNPLHCMDTHVHNSTKAKCVSWSHPGTHAL